MRLSVAPSKNIAIMVFPIYIFHVKRLLSPVKIMFSHAELMIAAIKLGTIVKSNKIFDICQEIRINQS